MVKKGKHQHLTFLLNAIVYKSIDLGLNTYIYHHVYLRSKGSNPGVVSPFEKRYLSKIEQFTLPGKSHC